jgi:hypothetical protein
MVPGSTHSSTFVGSAHVTPVRLVGRAPSFQWLPTRLHNFNCFRLSASLLFYDSEILTFELGDAR